MDRGTGAFTARAGESDTVRIRALSKSFGGERWLLRDADLAIAAGERVALLGESGCGKSTLLNIIAGLEPFDRGTVHTCGMPIQGLDADAAADLRRQRIGFVFQAFHLLGHLSAVRNVAIPLLLNGVDRDQAMARAHAALAGIGLSRRADAPATQLSGGEQQRVALMRALVHRPALVLADEPTGNLDPRSAGVAIREIAEQIEAAGAALLLVTHSEQAAALAARRIMIREARIEELN